MASARHAWRLLAANSSGANSFRAEVDLLLGRVDHAADRFEEAFALGCQLADPCWEGVAGRGLGLVAGARGDPARAIAILTDTLQRCARLPDAYVWGRVYVLDALCGQGVASRDARAAGWVDRLMADAASAGMRELVVRAHGHRAAMGDPRAAEAARLLAGELGNAALDRLIA
jgi:hypothetical protein